MGKRWDRIKQFLGLETDHPVSRKLYEEGWKEKGVEKLKEYLKNYCKKRNYSFIEKNDEIFSYGTILMDKKKGNGINFDISERWGAGFIAKFNDSRGRDIFDEKARRLDCSFSEMLELDSWKKKFEKWVN